MRNKYHQKVNGDVAKHNVWNLAESASLTPCFDDIDDNRDYRDGVLGGRDECTSCSSAQKAHQRQAQLPCMRTREPAPDVANIF